MRGRVFLLGVLAACLLFSLHASAEPPVYRSVHTEDKRIALTFDDGPHPHQTEEILAILSEHGLRATFFMVGENVVNYPDTARAVLRAGHEIGNHTYSHRHIAELNAHTLCEELERCEEVLDALGDVEVRLFRPPEGKITPYVEACAEESEYDLVLWSLDTRDWEGKSAAEITAAVLEHVRPGDIVLMHDYVGRNAHTAEALRILLPKLLAAGYEPVTVSELIGTNKRTGESS